MNLRYLVLCLTLGVATMPGCATPIEMEKMTLSPSDLEGYQGNTKFKHNLSVKEVLGGQETNPLTAPRIGNKEFKEALIHSLDSAQLLSPQPTGKFNLSAKLIHIDEPDAGSGIAFDLDSAATVKYIVVENTTNKEIYNKRIQTFHTATMADSFAAQTRFVLSQAGAVRENFKKFIGELYQIP